MSNNDIRSFPDEPVSNRNIKDSVFRDLFSEKKYLFQLYQVLHPEDKDTVIDDLKYVTLENVLVRDIYNDLGFLVGDRLLILVEAQSTWTENIIIRCLMYIARTLQEYLSETSQSLFSEKQVKIPEPELYVIYTGPARFDKSDISLSEEFFGGKQTALDVHVKVITDGQGGDIVNQYVLFTKVVRDQVRLYGQTREAIIQAIKICKNQNILKEYLTNREKEVIDIMITLYDQEEVLKDYIASEKREQREELTKEYAQSMYKNGVSTDIIAKSLNTNLKTVEQWLGLVPQTE